MASLNDLIANVGADTSGFTQPLKIAGEELDKFGNNAIGWGDKISHGLGIAAIGTAATVLSKNFSDATSKIADATKTIGEGATYAANEFESASDAVISAARRIESGVEKTGSVITSVFHTTADVLRDVETHFKLLVAAGIGVGATMVATASSTNTLIDGYRLLRIALSPTSFTVATVALGALAVAAAEAAYRTGGIVQKQAEMAVSSKLSIDVIQELTGTAKAANVSLEGLVSGVSAVQAQLGKEEGRKSVEALGVAIENTFGQTREANTVFQDLAIKIGAIEDPVKRAEAAYAVFGETLGHTLLPVLNQYSAIQQQNARDSEVMANKNRIALSNLKDDVDLFVKFLPTAGSIWSQWWDSLVQSAAIGVGRINQYLREEDAKIAEFLKGLGKLQSGAIGGAVVDNSGAEQAARNADIMGAAYKTMMAAQMEYVGSSGLAVIASGKFNGQIKELIETFKAATIQQLIEMDVGARTQSALKKSIGILTDNATAWEAYGKKMSLASFTSQQVKVDIDSIANSLHAVEGIKAWDALINGTFESAANLDQATKKMDGLITSSQTFEDLELGLAFHDIGIKTRDELIEMAAQAERTYQIIADSDKSSNAQILAADIDARRAQILVWKDMGIEVSQSQLDNLQKAEDKLRDMTTITQKHTRAQKTLWQNLGDSIGRIFSNDIGRGIADVIVMGGKMSDVFQKIMKDLAATIISTLVNGAIRQLMDALSGVIGQLGSIGGIMGKIMGVGGKTATSTVKSGVDSMGGDMGKITSSIGGAADSGAMGIVGLVAGVGTLISSIIGNFQMAKQETSLNAIEHNTRYTMMYVGERSDGGILGVSFRMLDALLYGTSVKCLESIRDSMLMITSGAAKGLSLATPGAGAIPSGAGGYYTLNFNFAGANVSSERAANDLAEFVTRQLRSVLR